MAGWVNKLYLGDNLQILREYVADESVDLIYLDPPFNSNATYNVLFKEQSGEASQAQITTFEDTWHWGLESEWAYREVVTEGPRDLANLLQALRAFLGQNDMMEYLTMMAVRLFELHRVLKPTGSLYLHCDPTASHYIKLLLDAVFGPKNFRNEIVWKRSLPHANVSRKFGSIHDVIFFYSKTDKYSWMRPHRPYFRPDGSLDPELAEHVLKQYDKIEEGTGRRFQATSLLNPNPNHPNLTYEFHGLQILTIEDLLARRTRLEYPRLAEATFQKARRVSKQRPIEQGGWEYDAHNSVEEERRGELAMTRYKWRAGSVAIGLSVYVVGSALGSMLVPPRQQGGWVTLLMLLFIGSCMATERGEWRLWKKVAVLPLLWATHGILMLPATFAFLPIVAASESLRMRANLVIALIASVPIVLIAMRRSRWFVERVESRLGSADLPWLWRALSWIFIGLRSLGYIGQATLFLLIEYAYISRNWVLIFHPFGPIIAFFTMLRLPVFWVFLVLSVLGYFGTQWAERRTATYGDIGVFPPM